VILWCKDPYEEAAASCWECDGIEHTGRRPVSRCSWGSRCWSANHFTETDVSARCTSQPQVSTHKFTNFQMVKGQRSCIAFCGKHIAELWSFICHILDHTVLPNMGEHTLPYRQVFWRDGRLSWHWYSLLKPKFHYADFTTWSRTLLQTQIMKVCDTNYVADFHDLCPRQSPRTLSRILLPTFPVHCNELNSIRATRVVLSQIVTDFVANISTCRDGLCSRLSWFLSVTFTETLWFDDLSPSVFATFIICVCDFPHGEVSVKVGVMEFRIYLDGLPVGRQSTIQVVITW